MLKFMTTRKTLYVHNYRFRSVEVESLLFSTKNRKHKQLRAAAKHSGGGMMILDICADLSWTAVEQDLRLSISLSLAQIGLCKRKNIVVQKREFLHTVLKKNDCMKLFLLNMVYQFDQSLVLVFPQGAFSFRLNFCSISNSNVKSVVLF